MNVLDSSFLIFIADSDSGSADGDDDRPSKNKKIMLKSSFA